MENLGAAPALASYLSRARGAMTAPDDIEVVSGVTQGLTLLTRMLLQDGADRLAPVAWFSPRRRKALLRWSSDTGGLIVEDDDAEFRYDRCF